MIMGFDMIIENKITIDQLMTLLMVVYDACKGVWVHNGTLAMNPLAQVVRSNKFMLVKQDC